jgi:hypothetical protein
MRLALVCFVSSLAACLSGCTADFSQFEPGVIEGDADTGAQIDDSATADSSVDMDTGTEMDSSVVDTGTAPVDTGTMPVDTGTMPVDTGTMPVDTGTLDMGADAAVPCTEAESKTLAGHCYFPINAMKWNNASNNCKGKGAHLATITSAAEQTLVESIRSGKDRWIGLSRPASSPSTEASFVWVTAEAVSYKKWASGEPNGSGECARVQAAGGWADQNCNTNYDAICERE